MLRTALDLTVLAALALVGAQLTPAAAAPDPAALTPAKKRIVFLPGHQSHGWDAHAFPADCTLLANALNQNVPGVDAVVIRTGWPKDVAALGNPAAIVIACDGNGILGGKAGYQAADALAKQGVGFAFLHYALDVGTDNGRHLLAWIGGFYEQNWSVNPSWLANFTTLPDHAITRGVRPFATHDEWYYHMRFQPDLKGVTPILTAIPPDSTRKGPDGPHSGNPAVRSRLGLPESVAWAYDRPDGGRGFGCTGGHVHWNYANDQYRKLLLNALCWIAKVEVPPGGVASATPTPEAMEANLDGKPPSGWTIENTRKMIEQVNR